MNRVKTALLGLAILVALAAAVFFWKYGEWVAIPKARAPMVALLKDPASAQTRNERITKAGVLCGEVNAKNSMGGYVGFKKYISYGPQSNYVEGTGLLNEESTQEMITRLEVQTELLRARNKQREGGEDVPAYSQQELHELAQRRMFEDRWQDSCASSQR